MIRRGRIAASFTTEFCVSSIMSKNRLRMAAAATQRIVEVALSRPLDDRASGDKRCPAPKVSEQKHVGKAPGVKPWE